jgi:hypothetical protein
MAILGALALAAAIVTQAPDPAIAAGHRTRGLAAGWGQGWPYAVPGWGKTRSDISFFAFHPRMGWFVADRLEIYGEATLLLYQRPAVAVSAGLGGLAGRLYWATDRTWVPYVTLGAGLLWTSLDVREIDRIFNFQIFYATAPTWCRRTAIVSSSSAGRRSLEPLTPLSTDSLAIQPRASTYRRSSWSWFSVVCSAVRNRT